MNLQTIPILGDSYQNWRFDNQDYPGPPIDGIAPEEIVSATQAGLPGTILIPTGVVSY